MAISKFCGMDVQTKGLQTIGMQCSTYLLVLSKHNVIERSVVGLNFVIQKRTTYVIKTVFYHLLVCCFYDYTHDQMELLPKGVNFILVSIFIKELCYVPLRSFS